MIHVYGSIGRDLVSFVPHLPRPGETVIGTEFHEFPGGKGANQAVAARRLGADTRMVGNVGADAHGEAMLAFLRGEGIDVSAVRRRDDAPTQLAFISVDDAGENSIVIIPGANWRWDHGVPPLEAVERGDIVIAQFEIPTAIVAAAFRGAKERGATTLLNPAPAREIPAALLADVDYLVVNEIELALLAQATPDGSDPASVVRAGRTLLACGPRCVITTLGPLGAVICSAQAERALPGSRVDAVDTTGAGDCFIGALACALADGADVEEAARFANRAAALSVTQRGAASSFPTRGFDLHLAGE
ncbi:MAG TPA: ribokinase [Candidatus Limnocylindria bacterium]|nr:ribokinase [Candidatus Limnocylindria bacterium]